VSYISRNVYMYSSGQRTRGGPPARGFGEGLTTFRQEDQHARKGFAKPCTWSKTGVGLL
jgi:hypothetical protein